VKTTFVGDIHGKVEAVEAALAQEGQVIFVGDVIDSYDRTVEDHKKCYDLMFDAIEKGKARSTLGNHELSYIFPHHQCSGWDKWRASLMRHYQTMILDRFEPYILLRPDFLVTHAGLTAPIWESAGLTLETLPKFLDDGWPDMKHPVHFIGQCRGGPNRYGGIFWATFGEDFEPVKGLTQVFGHTRQRGQGPIRCELDELGTPNYCIDCLDFNKNQFLELDV
jgi:hypothetical protein